MNEKRYLFESLKTAISWLEEMMVEDSASEASIVRTIHPELGTIFELIVHLPANS